ncbi:hypothetical protein FQA39_LY04761 [Lamprigera yunnana]|nr:hypothetical protein FQA39_LY04761 [Lamprigera yunnana]
MVSEYTREQLKICIAKMCITIGWHSSMTTPLEILTDLISNSIYQIGRATNEYANGFGMVEPNLDHLGLAFRDFHVNLSELQDYVKNVNCAEPMSMVPQYPLPKEDHLNFLKPGSKEVVTRPVHIHEHLPPMNPVLEVNQNQMESVKSDETEEAAVVDNNPPVFKRPPEVPQGDAFKRPRLLLEDEGRPTREISSVMMTTSGFLSPAREGKLPEARTPTPTLEPIVLLPPLLPEQIEPVVNKKVTKTTKKLEKRKEKVGRELFKPVSDPLLPKKMSNSKENIKMKAKHLQNGCNLVNDINISLVPVMKSNSGTPQRFNKALAAARLKTEKLNTTITPILLKPPANTPLATPNVPHVDKLFTEPDKRKINILKKISVKNEKSTKVKDEVKQESRESSPDLVIDETANDTSNKIHHLSNDITIELVDSTKLTKSVEKTERSYFYDDSPPRTPSTPKTPEMLSQSPPLNRGEKRKRKDKSKVKKIHKLCSPARLEQDPIDMDMERPKTPEAHVVMRQERIEPLTPTLPFPFFTPFAGPGLIPPPLGNSLFSHLSIPSLNIPSFGHPPYMSSLHASLAPKSFIQNIKSEDAMQKSSPIEQPSTSFTKLPSDTEVDISSPKTEKKSKKDKKDKLKKKNKKDKVKNKAEKKKLKEEKKDKEKTKKEKREKRKEKESRECESVVPKLTLKLGSLSPHSESQETRKLHIKPIIKKDEERVETLEMKREMSPELAKISALVTGQPKPKCAVPVPPTTADNYPPSPTDSSNVKKPLLKPIPKIRTKETPQEPQTSYAVDQYNTTPSSYTDAGGNTVWYCPACGKQDDGSPMIGCDDCDAWYHWVCVGIQIPPDESENWYCRLCISKKQEVLQSDKKKKRKKREKKDH